MRSSIRVFMVIGCCWADDHEMKGRSCFAGRKLYLQVTCLFRWFVFVFPSVVKWSSSTSSSTPVGTESFKRGSGLLIFNWVIWGILIDIPNFNWWWVSGRRPFEICGLWNILDCLKVIECKSGRALILYYYTNKKTI